MSLPLPNTDIRYRVTLPISQRELEVRPYLIREEKILLTAMESENKKDIATAVRQVLRNCTFDAKIDDLPLIDIEYLMLKLKMYSAGEMVPVHVKCHNKVGEGKTCGHIGTIEVDLEKDLVVDTENVEDSKVPLTDTIGVKLRPPSFRLFDTVMDFSGQASGVKINYDIIADAIEMIWDDEEVFKDFSGEEVQTFLSNLNKKQMKDIHKYLDSLPALQVKKDYKCKACGYEQELVLESFFDFFTD